MQTSRRAIARTRLAPRRATPPALGRSDASRLRRVADALFRRVVRLVAGGRCERCRRQPGTDTAHVIPRSYKATRWDTLNAFWLCRACHEYLGSASVAKSADRSRMGRFFERRFGPRTLESLVRDAQQRPRPMEKTIETLHRQLEALGA
jgi:hypothetical protein